MPQSEAFNNSKTLHRLPLSGSGQGAGVVALQGYGTVEDLRTERGISVARYGASPSANAATNTAAFNAANAAAIAAGRPVYIPPLGTYTIGRLASVTGALYWYSDTRNGCTVKVDISAYTGDTNPILNVAGSFKASGVTFDQNWIGTTYPAGHSRNDAYKASSWGGGSWFAVVDGGTTGSFEVTDSAVLNVFRGFLIKNMVRVLAARNVVNAEAGIGESVFAAETCTSVEYSGNYLVARNWFSNPGYTGANGLFGNTCRNVLIANNHMRGFQLVFHAIEPGASYSGWGVRCTVTNNIIETPPADTAFYRWDQCLVNGNIIRMSGDMGIAVSSSSYASITNNVIKGAHVGGIGVTECVAVVVANNSVTDIAQSYSEINTLASRYTSNGGAWVSGITCDYQSSGQKGVECVISGNSITWTSLPPISDSNGPIRALVNGIYVQSSANTSSQSTFSVSGNYVKDDSVNMPSFFVNVPSHRIYISGKTGTPIVGEVFSNGGVSFVYCADYGAGNLCFFKKLIGAIVGGTTYTGAQSGAQLTASALPQLVWLKCTGAGNFDRSTDYANANLAP